MTLRARSFFALLVAPSVVAACTLLGSRDVVQCKADSDCTHPNRRVCSDGLCVSGDGGTNVIDGATDAPLDTAPPTPACQVNADCKEDGPPLVCVNQRCEQVTQNELCPILLPEGDKVSKAYRKDRALLVGFYVQSPTSSIWKFAIQKALEEVNASLTGTFSVSAVLCVKGPKRAPMAAAHLAKLQAPAFVGQFELSEINAELTGVGPAIWSTLGHGFAVQARNNATFNNRFLVDEMESLAIGQGGADSKLLAAVKLAVTRLALPGDAPVVIVTPNGETSAVAAGERLRVALAGVQGVGAVTMKPVEPSYENAATEDKYGIEADRVILANPAIVVALGGDEMAYVLKQTEAKNFHPMWILGPRSKFNRQTIISSVNTNADLPNRIIGVDFSGTPQLHSAFVASVLPKQLGMGGIDHVYDAIYAVTFAGIAANQTRGDAPGRISTRELNTAFDSVLRGSTAYIGPSSFASAAAQAATGPIHYVGTTSDWNFAPGMPPGVRRMGASFYCVRKNEVAGQKPVDFAYYLDAADLGNPSVCGP